jgi:hypothetical protein
VKALSILQPYAWLIVHGYKDIENRSWSTPVRGRFLVHAGKKYDRHYHADMTWALRGDYNITLPAYESMPRGAIVGAVDLVDCVREHPSRWKDGGSWGFVLANAIALTQPVAWRGQLGFFEIPQMPSGDDEAQPPP